MKLNLLPATVSRGAQLKTAVALSIVLALLGFGIAIALTVVSAGNLAAARSDYEQAQLPAAQAVAKAKEADDLMALPAVQNLSTNVALSEAMMKHNDVYPDLYQSLKPYIPPYFRLTQWSASPLGPTQCQVNMTGTLQTFQQYADLMLSLLMNKEAVSVTRSGFTNDEMFVPQLVTIDQQGTPRRPNQQPIPDNSLERLAFFEAQPRPNPYQGVGNFGSGNDSTRLAMPGSSLINVTVVLNRGIQTPNPQASITGAGGGGAPGGFPGAGMTGRPGGPTGPGGPMGPGGPPPGMPGGPPMGGDR